MTLISAGYLLLAKDSDRFRHPIIHVSEISAGQTLVYPSYLPLATRYVNSYRIRSFVLAQECPRIDGVRRLMASSILGRSARCSDT